jgi:plastocyanin
MHTHQPTRSARRFVAVGVALLTLVGALAAGTAGAANTTTIKVGDNFFSPTKKTVTVGDTVVWKWNGSNTHNVTVTSGPQKFNSSDQSSGTYTRLFTKAGTYKIICTFHPGMEMTLKVNKAKKSAPTTTTPSSS